REPDDARAGIEAARRGHRSRGEHRDRSRRRQADRCDGDGHRPACVGVPRDRRPDRRGRDHDRPDLPSRSRLRAHRRQAHGARRAHSSGIVNRELAASPLGRATTYADAYDPSLLFPVDRAPLRAELGISSPLPFRGVDLWTAYELSWLDASGKPQVAIATLVVPATTPRIVESKSLKLYLTA